MTGPSLPDLPNIALWGLIATVAMTSILQGAQGLGLSRLSIPFLVGTTFTSNRSKAMILGFSAYVLGGWGFAVVYFLLFSSIGLYNWWIGAGLGLLHGLLLLVMALPLLPFVHPRMASNFDGAEARPQLEPPGFLGLNYGRGTPLALLVGQSLYGLILGGLAQLQGMSS